MGFAVTEMPQEWNTQDGPGGFVFPTSRYCGDPSGQRRTSEASLSHGAAVHMIKLTDARDQALLLGEPAGPFLFFRAYYSGK